MSEDVAQIKTIKREFCVKLNRRGQFSDLLGPHQHTLARMQIHDPHTVKTRIGKMMKQKYNCSSSIYRELLTLNIRLK